MTAREEWERLEDAWAQWKQRRTADGKGRSFPGADQLLELRKEFGWRTAAGQFPDGTPAPHAQARH